MYLYDDVLGIQSDSKRSEWANSAYAEFIDIKNEQLENENPENFKVLNEFPLTINILKELIYCIGHRIMLLIQYVA